MASLLSLSSLLGNSSIDDHEEVLKAADAALNKNKNDTEAQHVKVVALLKLDRFNEAFSVIESGGDKLKEAARLELAYVLYKTGKPGKAAEVARASGTGESDRGMRHVEAQASYRDQDFERAATLFTQLAEGAGSVAHEDMDLRINNGAVNAQLEWSGRGDLVKSKKPAREDMDAFETAYNAACGSVARGELGQAEVLLRRSKDLCNALEDLSEEEKKAEILPITVQQIFVLIKQDRLEDASKLASSINPQEITESSTQHVADTNTAAASSEPINPYLSHRSLYKAPETIKPDVPFGYQSDAIRRNNYALDLRSQKYSGIIESTASIISKSPSPTLDPNTNSLASFSAAAHARNQAGKEALKAVLPTLERRPNDVGLILVIVQLYVFGGNHGAAIALLESFFTRLTESATDSDMDVRFAPGLVGTLVSLYLARRQSSHVRSELSKAVKYWRQRSKSSSNSISPLSLAHLYKTAGSALLDSHDPEDQSLASEIFTELHNRDAEDRYTTAGLVAGLALTNASAITTSHLSALTPVERLLAGVDGSLLEEAGVAKLAASTPPPSTKRPATDAVAAPKAHKKPRATKMPKAYDPSKTVDPERWMPLKDRSYYRPKGGKKNKAKQAMLMQGGPVDEKEASRPGTPAAEVVKASGGQKKSAGKKKGKGGKW